MALIETTEPFTLPGFADHLYRANSTRGLSREALLRGLHGAFWGHQLAQHQLGQDQKAIADGRQHADTPPRGEGYEEPFYADVPHGSDPELPPARLPVTRYDIFYSLCRRNALPRTRVMRELAISPNEPASADRVGWFLVNMAYANGPDVLPSHGRAFIESLVLPLSMLRRFCRNNRLTEPPILKARLDGTQVDDAVIDAASPKRGRPSKCLGLYMEKFKARVEHHAVLDTPLAEARFLRHWLEATLAEQGALNDHRSLPQERTIRNNITKYYDFGSRKPI